MKRHYRKSHSTRMSQLKNRREREGYGRDYGYSQRDNREEVDTGIDGRIHYYIYVKAQNNDGKRIFMGPYESYQSAADVAFKELPDKQWEIIESKYRDIARATQAHRHTILTEEGHGLLDSIQPMRHKPRRNYNVM